MSLVSVHEMHQQRRSTYRGGVKSHLRVWIVTCDDKADGTVLAQASVDSPGTPHANDQSTTLTNLETNPQQNSDVIFIVQGEYLGAGTLATVTDPLTRPPEISYGSQEGTEDYFLDKSETPKRVTNSAGDPFAQNLTRDDGTLTMTITVNEATFPVLEMDQLAHTKNGGPVYIDGVTYAAGVLKMSAPTATKATENVATEGAAAAPVTYYKVVYAVNARHEGWDDKVLDVGTNQLIANADTSKRAKLLPIVDGAGLPLAKPWPLDGAGLKKPNFTDDPFVLTFKPYTAADWSGLKPFVESTWTT